MKFLTLCLVAALAIAGWRLYVLETKPEPEAPISFATPAPTPPPTVADLNQCVQVCGVAIGQTSEGLVILSAPPISSLELQREDILFKEGYSNLMQKIGTGLGIADLKPPQQATGSLFLKGFPQPERFVLGNKCRVIALATTEKTSYQGTTIPVYTMNVIIAPTRKAEAGPNVACKLGDCALIRGVIVAKIPEGIMIQQAPAPAGGWPDAISSSLDRTPELEKKQSQFTTADAENYGPTKQTAGSVLIDAPQEPRLHPMGTILLKGYPAEDTVAEGGRVKVIALPLNGTFSIRGQRIPAYTMSYALAPGKDWMFDTQHGALGQPNRLRTQ